MNKVTIDVRTLRIVAWLMVVGFILAAGIGVSVMLVKLGPKAEKVAPEEILQSVVVLEVRKEAVDIVLVAQGDMEAEMQTRLVSEVGGKVMEVSPRLEAGETFKEHEMLLQVDRTNYEAALANAESVMEDAKLAKVTEEANAEKARRDWEKLGNGRQPGPLVLREPQLASAEARVVAAQSAVDKALADLDRTRVGAPYDCRILSKSVDLGATVSPGTALLEVLSLGAVEVRLPLSLEDYGFLDRDAEGRVTGEVSASARIGGELRIWKGSLIRSEGVVEQATRSINVVARFEGEDGPPPGLFVRAEIAGRGLEGRVVLPREALIDARQVLLVRADDTLDFREVEVERTEAESVILRGGLEEGERVCLTPLNAPVKGMKVRVEEPADVAEEAVEPPKL